MKKYFVIFKQSFSQFTTYRLEILLQIFQSFVTPSLMLLSLSFSIPLSDLTFSPLVSYYFLVAVIFPLTKSNVDEEIDNLTNSGDINTFLIKPISLIKWLYLKSLSEKLVILLTLSPIFIIALYFQKLNILYILKLSGGLIISFSLSFLFSYLIGLFCFWIDEFWAIHNVKHVIVSLFGGAILPYSFFSSELSSLLKGLPFPYMISWPINIVRNNATVSELLVASIWVLVLFQMSKYFQKYAIKKYSFTAT